MISVFDIFKIGIGPSSSHTVGPMKAGKQFTDDLIAHNLLKDVTRVVVDVYGSLSLTGEKYRDIARVMGVKVEGMSLEEARNAAVEAVFALNRDVGIPPHLRDVGVRKEDIPALAQAALNDVCTGGNPREATLEDIVELYHTAW